MGYRIISLIASDASRVEAAALIEEFIAFAESRGVSAHSDLCVDEDLPVIEVSLDANSSMLNGITPFLVETARQIACDIDPTSPLLERIVTAIGLQLVNQIVDWSSVPNITSNRPGREFLERITGDSGYAELTAELLVHKERVSRQLAILLKVNGRDAWRKRDESRHLLRIDGLALLGCVRRLKRVADDIALRIPGDHLTNAIAKFEQRTEGLVAVRDIAEHIDEYGIGVGRLDKSRSEPGQVFEIEIANSVATIGARGNKVNLLAVSEVALSLGECLRVATDHYFIYMSMPPFADFDFVVEEDKGSQRLVKREGESPEMSSFRDAMNNVQLSANRMSAVCQNCGLAV